MAEIILEGGESVAQEIVQEIVNNATEPSNATQVVNQVVDNSKLMWWNTWYMWLAFVLIILGLFAFLLGIWYLEKKYQKPKEKRNILLIVLICCISTIAILLLSEFIGILPRGWNADNGRWLYPLIIISMLGIGLIVLNKGRTKKMEDAYQRVLLVAEDYYDARPLYDVAQGHTVKCFKKSFEKDDKGNLNPVGNFFLIVKGYDKFMLIIQISLTDLSINYMHEDPDIEFVRKELKKSIGVVADAYIEEKSKLDQSQLLNKPDDVKGQPST